MHMHLPARAWTYSCVWAVCVPRAHPPHDPHTHTRARLHLHTRPCTRIRPPTQHNSIVTITLSTIATFTTTTTTTTATYHQLYGSYAAITGGNVSEALHDLTGFACLDYNVTSPATAKEIEEGGFWTNLHARARDGSALIACAWCVPPEEVRGSLAA